MNSKSITVVGAGIVGLAIGREFAAAGSRVTILEKEADIAWHQTGRNSGVIHAGPYYKPHSLKAKLCVQGNRAMVEFAKDHDLNFKITGKLIVASTDSQIANLHKVYERATANGVKVSMLEPSRIRELEPNCVAAAALHVEETGIISFKEVAAAMARDISLNGGEIVLGSEVCEIRNISNRVLVTHSKGEVSSDILINTAGLQSDRVATLAGLRPKVKIFPFLGQYFDLVQPKQGLINGLIYPAPDPEFPFLGVHLTKTLSGEVHAGPNAVLTMAREGYGSQRVNFRDALETLSHPGLPKFLWRNRKLALDELLRLSSRERFAQSISQLVSGISASDLIVGPSGIRAQAIDRLGNLVDDFVIQREGNQIHVLNAPSPAATASISIARYIRSKVASE